MNILPLSEVLQLKPGTIIPGMRGTIKAVANRYPETGWAEQKLSDNTVRQWSVQDIVLNGEGAEIVIKVADKEPITADKVGQSVYFLAHQKERGGLSGLKLDTEDGQLIVRCSKTGEMVFGQPASAVNAPVPPPHLALNPEASPATRNLFNPTAAAPSGPSAAPFQIEPFCDMYEAIFKRMLPQQDKGMDPQAATDTIFRVATLLLAQPK